MILWSILNNFFGMEQVKDLRSSFPYWYSLFQNDLLKKMSLSPLSYLDVFVAFEGVGGKLSILLHSTICLYLGQQNNVLISVA